MSVSGRESGHETHEPNRMQNLSGRTRVVAVWGHPVSHSRSPAMQNAALAALGLDWVYVPFDVVPGALGEAVRGLRAMGFVGANCTVPLKEQVAAFADEVDAEASKIGSVNTLTLGMDGVLRASSTDGPGLLWDLRRSGIEPAGKRVLIWGAGGSARAVACALSNCGASVTVANRTESKARAVASLANGAAVGLGSREYDDAVRAADLLINTTTLGMGGSGMPPLPKNALHSEQVVYDLVYAPVRTPLLEHAEDRGCRTLNGLGLLVCQGALSLSAWTGLPPERMPLAIMARAAAQPDTK